MLDLTNLDTIKNIIKENRLWPKKGYGQNFLIAKNPLDQIIKSANIRNDEVVVEIGPGFGVLTQELAKHAKLVLAIESDYNLVEYLRKYFKGTKNVKIIHQDALIYDLESIDGSYKLVSNLPYNITSPIIRKFLESSSDTITRHSQKDVHSIEASQGLSMALATHFLQYDSHSNYKLKAMILMVQKEVAERLNAKPGSADRGILTVMIELFGGVYPDQSGGAEIVEIVPRNCFYPIPKVDSAIIKISVDPHLPTGGISVDPRSLMKFVKIGFSQKRRQIHHPLSANLHLPSDKIKDILKSVGVAPTLRAEDLTVDEWIKLYTGIKFKF